MVRRLAAVLALGTLVACSPDSPTPPSAPSLSVDAGARQHLVVFTSAIPADLDARVAALGGTVSARLDQIAVAAVTGLSDAAAAELARSEGVQEVGLDGVTTLAEPAAVALESVEGLTLDAAAVEAQSQANPAAAVLFGRQWNMKVIGADTAWAKGQLGDPSVTVYVLDTGIDYTNPDLAASRFGPARVDLSRSVSFVPSDDTLIAKNFPGVHPIADLLFHGTHVATQVSSNAFAFAGVTSKVTLVGVKVLGADGKGSSLAVYQGLVYAADHDADVINMSLGGGWLKSTDHLLNAIENRVVTYVRRKGALIVSAAGNAGMDLQHDVLYPSDTTGPSFYASACEAPNVICVSATGPTRADYLPPPNDKIFNPNGKWYDIDAIAPYSNYGNKVFVAAPGGNAGGPVSAVCSHFTLLAGFEACRTANLVLNASGTSAAAPHVSGLAALLVQAVGRDNPAQLRAAIKAGAVDLGPVDRDPQYGFGRISVPKALRAAGMIP